MRFGSANSEDTLINFWAGLGALVRIGPWFDTLFCQGDGATFQMRNKILGDGTSWGGALALLVDRAHRIDIALPNGEQLLDVRRFSQGFSERGNEFIGLVETLARATG